YFHDQRKHGVFTRFMDKTTKLFLANQGDLMLIDNARLALNVLNRLVLSNKHALLFVEARAHKAILPLLQCREMGVLQAALEVLGRLSDWVESCRLDLCQSTAVDVCLQMA
ncbi:hypothetical protein PFISCL1PPCAC_10963, partial [Pristionchus fissidentatus]